MQKAIGEVRALLKDKSLRLTPQREAVLRVLLADTGEHLTAEDIYDRTRNEYADIGLATIYRTLELFEDLGVVSVLEFGEGGRRYESALGKDHHHLLCIDCGKITEFNEDLLGELQETVAKESGFQILNHSLRFFGYCKHCKAKYQPEVKE